MSFQIMLCPICTITLDEISLRSGSGWSCSKCKGKAVNAHTLKIISDPEKIQKFWTAALHMARPSQHKCPKCKRNMKSHRADKELGGMDLGLCSDCQFVWFNCGDLSKVPAATHKEIIERVKQNIPLPTHVKPAHIPGRWTGNIIDDEEKQEAAIERNAEVAEAAVQLLAIVGKIISSIPSGDD